MSAGEAANTRSAEFINASRNREPGGVKVEGKHIYLIEHPGEKEAGISSFTDNIVITIESGDPGGDIEGPDSFQEFMLQSLKEWYDGASVVLIENKEQR